MSELMTINLARGFFNVVDGHNVLKADFTDYHCANQRFCFQKDKYLSNLPDISDMYAVLKAGGLPGDVIIDCLISFYFPLRYFRTGNFEKMALVMGFIGMRGSGKTCSAVMVAICDFLLRGLPVWSNVPFAVRVCYKDAEKIFTSTPLDDLDMLDLSQEFGAGAVLVDEVNMEGMEATRFASGANLQFSYVLQQIRKRQLSLIWTCQGWNWIDNRLRWQSDYVIACRDAAFEKKKHEADGLGDKCYWRVHDLSGISGKFDYDYELKHRYLSDYLVGTHLVWLRPWWAAYSTKLLQGKENYVQKYKAELKEKQNIANQALPEPVKFAVPEVSNTVGDLVKTICDSGVEKVACKLVWDSIGTSDKRLQTEVGRLFANNGYVRRGNSGTGRYWIKKEQKEEG